LNICEIDSERATGFELGILRCCDLAKSLSRHLPMRFVSKIQVHVHHERVRIDASLISLAPVSDRNFMGSKGTKGISLTILSREKVEPWTLLREN
jgi:hypothetical protein